MWPGLGSSRHQHTTFRIGDDVVHIDWLDGSGYGPSFGLRTHLVCVNDVLAGAGWTFGCLGGSGYVYPKVTRVGRRGVVICD